MLQESRVRFTVNLLQLLFLSHVKFFGVIFCWGQTFFLWIFLLSTFSSETLHICLSFRWSVCLSLLVYLSLSLSHFLLISLSFFLSIGLCMSLSIYLYVSVSLSLSLSSLCLSLCVYLCVSLFVYLYVSLSLSHNLCPQQQNLITFPSNHITFQRNHRIINLTLPISHKKARKKNLCFISFIVSKHKHKYRSTTHYPRNPQIPKSPELWKQIFGAKVLWIWIVSSKGL